MKLLITAGNTQTPIDRVRCITNIFSGKTGTLVALEAFRRGHDVTLLSSHPEVVGDLVPEFQAPEDRWTVRPYRTFDDLERLMDEAIPKSNFDAIVHSAAVSDYRLEGTYVPVQGSTFDPMTGRWRADLHQPTLMDVSKGKVKSSHPELWFRMVPTPKLIDRIRNPWGFRGVLVKFKLEVGLTQVELIDIAKKSRAQSDADFVVANTLEGMQRLAFIGDRDDQFEEVVRLSLPRRILEKIEAKAN